MEAMAIVLMMMIDHQLDASVIEATRDLIVLVQPKRLLPITLLLY